MASPLDGMDASARALLDYLEGRRSRVRAAAEQRATRARKPRLPRGAELALEAYLLDVSRKISDAIQKALAPDMQRAKLRAAAEKADRADAPVGWRLAARTDADLIGLFSRTLFGDLEIRIAEITRTAGNPAILDRYGRRLNEENAQEMERVLGIAAETSSPLVAAALRRYRTEVANLITSIGQDQLASVRDLVATAGQSGMRVETLAKEIEQRYAVSESRARLIARDQTLKANSQITQVRQKAVGVTSYRWSTSNDGKVRDAHAALEGTVHSWDDPPVTNPEGDRNHPGEDFQCRCTAVPILPA